MNTVFTATFFVIQIHSQFGDTNGDTNFVTDRVILGPFGRETGRGQETPNRYHPKFVDVSEHSNHSPRTKLQSPFDSPRRFGGKSNLSPKTKRQIMELSNSGCGAK